MPSSRASSQPRDRIHVSSIAFLYCLSGNKTHGWETKDKLQNSELKKDLSTSLFYRLRKTPVQIQRFGKNQQLIVVKCWTGAQVFRLSLV